MSGDENDDDKNSRKRALTGIGHFYFWIDSVVQATY